MRFGGGKRLVEMMVWCARMCCKLLRVPVCVGERVDALVVESVLLVGDPQCWAVGMHEVLLLVVVVVVMVVACRCCALVVALESVLGLCFVGPQVVRSYAWSSLVGSAAVVAG